MKETSDLGLNFVRLEVSLVRVAVLSEASSANAPEVKSQLGFVVLMVCNHKRENIVHYESNRYHRVEQFLMTAEVRAFAYAFVHDYLLQEILEGLIGREISLEAFVDSSTLFDAIAKDSETAERWLQIDVFALEESYRRG